jgi:hypothetical protein
VQGQVPVGSDVREWRCMMGNMNERVLDVWKNHSNR